MNGIDFVSSYLIPINTIIEQVLDESEVTKNLKTICSDNVVIEKKVLNKYAKLNKEYYLVPKNKLMNDKSCVKISFKYLKALKLLLNIKSIYDTENHGKNNFASLIFNHIVLDEKNNTIKVSSCSSKQNKWWWEIEEGLNVFLIPGIKDLVENILSEDESKLFIGQLTHVLKSDNYTKLDKYVCKDVLIKEVTYEKLYQNFFHCKSKLTKKGGNILVNIAKHNPILSNNMCKTKTTYKVKYKLQFKQMIQIMKNNYIKNLKKVKKLLEMIIMKNDNSGYMYRNISLRQLYEIEIKVKRTIILFYMQSLMDYKNILNTIRIYT